MHAYLPLQMGRTEPRRNRKRSTRKHHAQRSGPKHVAQRLAGKIRDYEWAHGLRYVVWRVRWSLLDKSGGDMTFAESLRQARRFASVQRAYGFSYVRITRAARKPKGSP